MKTNPTPEINIEGSMFVLFGGKAYEVNPKLTNKTSYSLVIPEQGLIRAHINNNMHIQYMRVREKCTMTSTSNDLPAQVLMKYPPVFYLEPYVESKIQRKYAMGLKHETSTTNDLQKVYHCEIDQQAANLADKWNVGEK